MNEKKRNTIVIAILIMALVLLFVVALSVWYSTTKMSFFGYPYVGGGVSEFHCNTEGFHNEGGKYRFGFRSYEFASLKNDIEVKLGDTVSFEFDEVGNLVAETGEAFFKDTIIPSGKMTTVLFAEDIQRTQLAKYVIVANCRGNIWVSEYPDWEETVHLEDTTYGKASVDARGFCPVGKEWDFRGMVVDFLFSEEKEIRAEYYAPDNYAMLSLKPEELMYPESTHTIFNDFFLNEGDVLTLYLTDASALSVALCQGALWTLIQE